MAAAAAAAPAHPADMDRFVETFLAGEALRRLLVHACNHAVSFVADPITDTVCAMLSTPVAAVFSMTAVMPFRDKAQIALPYTYMTAAQRAYVHELLGDPAHGVLRRNNCVEVRFEGAPRAPACLPALGVLLAMCETVIGGGGGARDARQMLAVTNIMLQRVRCAVHISHDVFAALQARVGSGVACGAAAPRIEEGGGGGGGGEEHEARAGHARGKRRAGAL